MTRTAEPFTTLHVDLDKLPHRHKPTDRTYVNDRRAGVTKPDVIEIFERDDPRHPLNSKPVVPNRADRRARGQRNLSRLQRNQAKLRPSEMVRHLTRYPLYSIRLRRKDMGPAGLTLPELKRHAAIEEAARTLAASSGWSFDEAFRSVSRALSSVKHTLPDMRRVVTAGEINALKDGESTANGMVTASGGSYIVQPGAQIIGDNTPPAMSRALSSVKFMLHVADSTAPTVAELEAGTEIGGVTSWTVE